MNGSRIAYGWRRASWRGQALLIAVLVLFAVATLAALFAAIIGSQVVQVTRYSDVVELRSIAEAGLNFANEQLTFGMDGADWRPAVGSRYRCGRGQFSLTVDYGPDPSQLQSRAVRVISTAFFPDNPFVRHTILALKPVLLTDYLRFVTDRFEANQPAALGSTGVEMGGQPRPGGYVLNLMGPIRSNTDLVWYGQSQVALSTGTAASGAPGTPSWQHLGILRDDRIEVAGQMRPADLRPDSMDVLKLWVDGAVRANNLFYPFQANEQQDYSAGFPDWINRQTDLAKPNTWRLLADLPERDIPGLWPISRTYLSVPRIHPPDLQALNPDLRTNRFWALTRDSGSWVNVGGALVNNGAWGWGWANFGGIYIDNTNDIQYQHDLEKLRLNWMASVGLHGGSGDSRAAAAGGPLAGPADWWDKTGRYYAPPGVEIIVHGERTGDVTCPYLEIIRHDLRQYTDPTGGQTPRYYYWRGPDGAAILATGSLPWAGATCNPSIRGGALGVAGARAIFPFPPNGVVYSEGNVIIKGILPARKSDISGDDQYAYLDRATYSAEAGRDRRFDLTVVSGGTIYVEGDLLTPRGAGIIQDTPEADQDLGTRIALLARDHVCLNTTALNPRPSDLYRTVMVGDPPQASYYNDAQPLYPPGTGYPKYAFLQGARDPAANSDAGAEAWDEKPMPTVPLQVAFLYDNVRLRDWALRQQIADVRLIMGHSGWYDLYAEDPSEANLPDSRVKVETQLMIDPLATAGQTVRPWEQGGGTTDWYTFIRPPADPTLNQSAHWYAALRDYLEFLPDRYQLMAVHNPAVSPPVAPLLTGNDAIVFNSRITPVREQDADGNWHWVVQPQQLGYILGPIAIAPPSHQKDANGNLLPPPAPLEVKVQAAVYAQNGSWFIIPGPWFNEDPDEKNYEGAYPGYQEPLNIQITFQGAISENMPAPLGDVADWTSKWSGPLGADASSFLSYEYDPYLRWSEVQDAWGRLYPRFRRFPLTPDLMIWGQRVTGQPGG